MSDDRSGSGGSRDAAERGEGGGEQGKEGSEGSEESGEPIGPFPTWRSLYITVLVWSAVTVGALYAVTVLFDRSLP